MEYVYDIIDAFLGNLHILKMDVERFNVSIGWVLAEIIVHKNQHLRFRTITSADTVCWKLQNAQK